MDHEKILHEDKQKILEEAFTILQATHAVHYQASGEDFTRQALAGLYDLVVAAIEHRDLTEVVAYAERVAVDRFTAGFDISEVQAAFNALEESMWRHLVAEDAPEDLTRAVGMLGTVLGAGKDALARTYVSLASHRHVTSLDLGALFTGAGA